MNEHEKLSKLIRNLIEGVLATCIFILIALLSYKVDEKFGLVDKIIGN
jgi:hypothetical protein